jgi:hypothetical protein
MVHTKLGYRPNWTIVCSGLLPESKTAFCRSAFLFPGGNYLAHFRRVAIGISLLVGDHTKVSENARRQPLDEAPGPSNPHPMKPLKFKIYFAVACESFERKVGTGIEGEP